MYLVCYNADEVRKQAAGVFDDMVRVSVGLEDIEDLKEDFAQAIQKTKGGI